MFDEFGLVASLQDEEGGGLLFEMGYIEIGHCPNGDYIVMNVDRHFGAIRYICHDECAAGNEFEDISGCSKVVTPSLGDFAVGIDQQKIGHDNFDELSA